MHTLDGKSFSSFLPLFFFFSCCFLFLSRFWLSRVSQVNNYEKTTIRNEEKEKTHKVEIMIKVFRKFSLLFLAWKNTTFLFSCIVMQEKLKLVLWVIAIVAALSFYNFLKLKLSVLFYSILDKRFLFYIFVSLHDFMILLRI